MAQIISQVALCFMLVLTTTWCIIVYRKLASMKTDGGAIRDLIDSLNQATKRADQTILAMRLVIKEADGRLQAIADFDKRERQKERSPSPRDEERRMAALSHAAKRASRPEQRVRIEDAPMGPHGSFASNEAQRPASSRYRNYADVLPVNDVTGRDDAVSEATPSEDELERLALSIARLR